MTQPAPDPQLNTWAKPLLLLALAAFAAAVVLALAPISANGVDCGNAMHPNNNAGDVADVTNALLGQPAENIAAACDDKTSSRRTLTYAIGGPSLALVFIAFIALPKAPRRDET
jgi:hypothetical protein